MQLYYFLAVLLGIGGLVQIAMLWLQLGALRRHKHRCFRYLVVGSACGIVYSVLLTFSYVLPVSTGVATAIYLASLVALLPAYWLGLAGTAMLLQSYRQLAEQGTGETQIGA